MLAAIEELSHLGGDRRQLAIVGQLGTYAKIGIGTCTNLHDLRVEVDKDELTTLRLGRLAQIDMPQARREILSVLLGLDAEVKRNGHLAHRSGRRRFVFILLLLIIVHILIIRRRLRLLVGKHASQALLHALACDIYIFLQSLELGLQRIHLVLNAFQRALSRCFSRDVELEILVLVVAFVFHADL